MITFDTAPLAAEAPPPPCTRVLNPLTGPGRAADPVAAMARDLQDIVAVRGSADGDDLVLRGWLPDEIAAHGPHAHAYLRAAAL